MAATRATGVLEDPRFGEHSGPAGHPERPGRSVAVHAAVAARADRLATLAPRPATAAEIARIHSREHLERVAEACRVAPTHLDPDTYVSPRSYEVALLAAGGCIDLALRVARGELRTGLAAVRPPGHHAEWGRAMGFCLFNNVAIAARALQQEERVDRVLIVDWDVHHGNGTQHSFDEDPSVLYFSTHQFPYYPGTGDAGEAGRGDGHGFTVNVPLPAGCGDAEYSGAMQRILAPVARAFRPEFILVSCGFDAHEDDPLAAMNVTAAGFAEMARTLRGLADELCGGRLVCVLEGGYALSGLEQGTGAVLDALLAESAASIPLGPTAGGAAAAPAAHLDALERVIERLRAVHGPRYRDLGLR
jgi:acetoin utilization deacetylase AcuC-like enzyme